MYRRLRGSRCARVRCGARRGVHSTPPRAGSQGLRSVLKAEMRDMEKAGTYKTERVITSPQRAMVSVASVDQPVLNFCANNYLGLSDDTRIVSAAKAALDSHGFGMSSVRFICGTQDIHKQLEAKLSAFHEKEDTILFPSAFDANGGIFESLLGPEDAVLSDALNHASIIDGIRLCKARRFRYEHMDVRDLEAKLIEARDARVRLIVTDGAFSMDGDIAPLEAICDLAERHDAVVMTDECHGSGFLGARGRGALEHCGVLDRVDIVSSTLGKALGGATGGFVTGPKEVVDMCRQRARPYLFSNSVAPAVVGAGLEALRLLESSPQLIANVTRNTQHFRGRMKEAGFHVMGNDAHPIAPILIGDAREAAEMADAMLRLGVYVIGFSYPVVPKGQARIRVQLSASHTIQQVDQCVDAFIAVRKQRQEQQEQ